MTGPVTGFKAPKSAAGKAYIEKHGNPLQASAMTDTNELAERLRENAEVGRYCGSDYMDAASTIKRLQRELECLRAEVKEWACDACNTVYPGPPQKGTACVVCPDCGGRTAPRSTIDLIRTRRQLDEARKDTPNINQHEVADAFWKAWKENGESGRHGYYESTWISIRAAITAARS